MEASKRERIILFGGVPIAAAIIGVVGTMLAQYWLGSDDTVKSIAAVASDHSMTAADKLKAMEIVNKGSAQFYDFLNATLRFLALPLGVIAVAVAGWIHRR